MNNLSHALKALAFIILSGMVILIMFLSGQADFGTILAASAFMIAYSEFRKWREELIDSKRIELAIRLGVAAIRMREAFKEARSPVSFGPPRKEDETYEEYRKRIDEHEARERVEIVRSAIRRLRELKWESEILFGDEENDFLSNMIVILVSLP